MLSKVKTIIFDIGGVLVDLDFERCIESFRALGVEGAENLVSCYHPVEFFGELERGEIDTAEFYNRMREWSGMPTLSDDEICRAYRSLLVGIPVEKLRMIKSLRERGFQVLALSNINEVMLPPIFDFFKADSLEVNDYFDHLYLSFEMGVMKPNRRIYEMLIEESGIVPSESLFIDDGIHNIEAAREMGMQVYLATAREDFSHLFVQ